MDSFRHSSRGSNTSSALLQDKLREKRKQAQHASNICETNDAASLAGKRTIETSSSPLCSLSGQDMATLEDRVEASSNKKTQHVPKEMGLRETKEVSAAVFSDSNRLNTF